MGQGHSWVMGHSLQPGSGRGLVVPPTPATNTGRGFRQPFCSAYCRTRSMAGNRRGGHSQEMFPSHGHLPPSPEALTTLPLTFSSPLGAPPVPESRVGGGACWCVGLACRCRAWILPFLPLVQVSPVCLSPALQNVSSGCRVLGEGLPRHRLGRVGGGAEAQRWALSSSSCFSLFLLILRSVPSPFQ